MDLQELLEKTIYEECEQEGKRSGEADFEKEVKRRGIKQIFSRIRYLQGNGKLEGLNRTIKQLWK